MNGRTLRPIIVDIAAPIALYYGIAGAGGGIWLALAVSGAVPVISVLAGLVSGRKPDLTGLIMVAALALSAVLSLVTGSPRALLVRDGLVTAGWAGYLYLSLLASRPVTFTVTRGLLEGRSAWDARTRTWREPAAATWDELWQHAPRFRSIWRVITVIWGTAILADAVIRIVIAQTLPIGDVPAINGALWPATFVILQVVTNIYFLRSGFWQILLTGPTERTPPPSPLPAGGQVQAGGGRKR